jgi:uncharacterized membrane protein YphA (DoxX/SURF4 family)
MRHEQCRLPSLALLGLQSWLSPASLPTRTAICTALNGLSIWSAADSTCAERNKAGLEPNLDRRATMNPPWTGLAKFSSLFLRLALGISFLSAVADRFGLWGVYGQPNVSWGNYARFVDYTAKLNWFLPAAMIPTLAIIATAAETLLGLLLVLGWKTRITALLSGVLLTIFSLTMTIALGVKAPLNFSVFSAAGGALLLGAFANFPVSLDEFFRRSRQRK